MKRHESPHEPRHGAQAPEAPPQHGHHPGDAWQAAIGAYLAKRCDMAPPDICKVLRTCEYDATTRALYLRLARETMP